MNVCSEGEHVYVGEGRRGREVDIKIIIVDIHDQFFAHNTIASSIIVCIPAMLLVGLIQK